jgi:hypothetical protein
MPDPVAGRISVVERACLRNCGSASAAPFGLKFQDGEIAVFIPWRGWQPKARRNRMGDRAGEVGGRSPWAVIAFGVSDNSGKAD